MAGGNVTHRECAARQVMVLAASLHVLPVPSLPPPGQVVLLGSGMDTRPWRLPLGSRVAWFEVDMVGTRCQGCVDLAASACRLR